MFNADDYVAPKDQRKLDEFILFAMAAADSRRSRIPAGCRRTTKSASAPA